MTFHTRFEIDIVDALSSQLVRALNVLTAAPLNKTSIAAVEEGQGVYALLHKKKMVYVGKSKDLRARLADHFEKVTGRRHLDVADLTFKCLYVHRNWTALAPEASLIKFYKQQGAGDCVWNGAGFGPHDPGRIRETTNKPSDGFDVLYPIIDDYACAWVRAGSWNVLELLISLKENLPFLLRYQVAKHYRTGHPDYNNVFVKVPTPAMPARDLLALIARKLLGWQATVFASHMILYKELEVYAHGRKL